MGGPRHRVHGFTLDYRSKPRPPYEPDAEDEDHGPEPSESYASPSAFSTLPADIWREILCQLAADYCYGALSNVASTCRALDELTAPILYHRFPVTEGTLLSLALHFPIGTEAARLKLLEQVCEYQHEALELVRISPKVASRRRRRLRLVKALELAQRTSWLGPALEAFFNSCSGLVFPNVRAATVRALGTWPNFCFCCYSPWRLAYSVILGRLAHPEEVCYNFPAVEEPPEDVSRWVARPKEAHIQPLMPIDLVFDPAWLGPRVRKVTYHDHSAEDGLVALQNVHHVVHIPIAPGPNPNRRRFCRRAFIQAAIRDKTVRYGKDTTFEFVLDSLADDEWEGVDPAPGSEWDEKAGQEKEYAPVSHSLNHHTNGGHHAHAHNGYGSSATRAIEYFYWSNVREPPAANLAEEKAATFEIDRCPTPSSWDRIRDDADCVEWSMAEGHEPCTACGMPLVSEDMVTQPGSASSLLRPRPAKGVLN
ncbi:hypothetical protein A1Q1_07723 [Trichosporon asahii var. asahii CBS 2479]|uniref:F-box domain-containing protein n=1 Tax=Trichosporon asahii var. asahii (strain ATCC 90039 / CBS 2479 / JCM 2466 / KCTC 7840 / NBRC 103889/ NCYC 2677 / UAMH 7654) TaxID=1186058 RepID=J5R7N8_TRIAS|nr:hypothetical protein A1Q1_07723 [Trichosporon asahii var. asahii CBS 2479]EJT51128.1 hypothetical protein A1Q1_07723 [Trichosporon asahii var. asahii CBS 2479]